MASIEAVQAARSGRGYRLIAMLDGTADIVQGYGQPGARLIAGYGRSQFLGEIGMLTGQRAYLTVVATSPGRVRGIPATQQPGPRRPVGPAENVPRR